MPKQYAVIVIDLDRLPGDTAKGRWPATRDLLAAAAVELCAEPLNLPASLRHNGNRVGVVTAGCQDPYALLDRIRDELHPDDSIRKDLVDARQGGRERRPGEDWSTAKCRNSHSSRGPCAFCARPILPKHGYCAYRRGERAHYDCAPGLGTDIVAKP